MTTVLEQEKFVMLATVWAMTKMNVRVILATMTHQIHVLLVVKEIIKAL
jgi:hypothetical protein